VQEVFFVGRLLPDLAARVVLDGLALELAAMVLGAADQIPLRIEEDRLPFELAVPVEGTDRIRAAGVAELARLWISGDGSDPSGNTPL
jgi:hypothetical protein